MLCLLQSHVSHERQMLYYSWISFHSQCHAPLSNTPWVIKVMMTVDPHYLCSWVELGQVNLSISIMLGNDISNKEYLMTPFIENCWLFCCIANTLEDGCLSCIGTANDKDAKTLGELSNIFCLSLLSFNILCSLEFGVGKRHLCGWDA